MFCSSVVTEHVACDVEMITGICSQGEKLYARRFNREPTVVYTRNEIGTHLQLG